MPSLESANYVRRHTSGRILMVDRVVPDCPPDQAPATCRLLLNELLARSLEGDHCLWGADAGEKELMLADPEHQCITSPLQIIDILRSEVNSQNQPA